MQARVSSVSDKHNKNDYHSEFKKEIDNVILKYGDKISIDDQFKIMIKCIEDVCETEAANIRRKELMEQGLV